MQKSRYKTVRVIHQLFMQNWRTMEKSWAITQKNQGF